MYILGISAFYHDSAACLIKDGRVIAAAEEERFTREKHSYQFPIYAIRFCLERNNLKIQDVEFIAYYEKPLLRFERVLDTFVQTYPISLRSFLKGMPEWLGQKIKIEKTIRYKLGFKGKIYFIPHHTSHASASYFPSPFKESAILTVDGIGEYQTTALWIGKENKLTLLKYINFPHSLGLFYSTFTSFLGFRVNEDEYKVMGLGAYGKPVFKKEMYKIIDIKQDGSFNLDLKYFAFRQGVRMWNNNFINLFGQPRIPHEIITQRHKDIASSCQYVLEEAYFKILNYLYSITKIKNLCIGGGVALNALANGKIYTKTPFKKVYIIGPAGDGGSALGAPLFLYHNILGNRNRSFINNLYLGSQYSSEKIEQKLKESKPELDFVKFNDIRRLTTKTAYLLAQNNIIGWFQGKMEYGPRALGSRSILANPKNLSMKDKVNRIKIREQFRPFAGSILQEYVNEYFEVPENNHFSPFMLFCFKVKKEKKDSLAAIVHKDNTCRIQTVNKANGQYYLLIKEFFKLTGIPCILNTSFNLKREPIVENPQQAIDDFLKTKMDHLIIGSYLVSRPTKQ